MLIHLVKNPGLLLKMETFIITSFFNTEIGTYVATTFMLFDDWTMIFNILLCRGSHHLHLYNFYSPMAITRSNKVSFSNQLPNAANNPIFLKELLVRETINKNIRLAKPNLLMVPLKLLIPRVMQPTTVRLTTI